ncbi:DeoR/GlpR family DNA-binding transcription regulator [Vreelandella aquamarina]|uniref:DeoR/GlpR family DNA-binding transcription regulator n=1 Tax=Vreelandella aquamarina TaxID=77097 RepID=UPI00384AC2C5
MKERSAARLEKLHDILSQGRVVHLREAATLCEVSEMTIRRDLACQESEQQEIHLLGGRLLLNSRLAPVYDMAEQQASRYPAKQALCQRVVEQIEDGDTLFIDCGSTLIPLAGMLQRFSELTVVTYALNVANAVAPLSNVRLVLLGGLYYPASQSFGSDTMASRIEGLGINKALISAAGVDAQRGVSCFHFHEVAPKRAAIATAMQRWLVADASKVGVVRPAYFAMLDEFDALFTDAPELALTKSAQPSC